MNIFHGTNSVILFKPPFVVDFITNAPSAHADLCVITRTFCVRVVHVRPSLEARARVLSASGDDDPARTLPVPSQAIPLPSHAMLVARALVLGTPPPIVLTPLDEADHRCCDATFDVKNASVDGVVDGRK